MIIVYWRFKYWKLDSEPLLQSIIMQHNSDFDMSRMKYQEFKSLNQLSTNSNVQFEKKTSKNGKLFAFCMLSISSVLLALQNMRRVTLPCCHLYTLLFSCHRLPTFPSFHLSRAV